MPRCSGCGNEFPASARFCAICGQQAVGATPTTPPGSAYGQAYAAPADGNNKTKVIVAAAIIVLLLAVAGLALKLFGVLGAKPTEATPAAVLNAPTTQTVAPVLNAPQVQMPNAPVIQPPVPAGTPMPNDVIAYLRWLKQFEAARHDLEDRSEGQVKVVLMETVKDGMTGGANSSLLDGDPTDATAGSPASKPKSAFDFHVIDQMIQQWNQVTGLFQAKTPPNPCAQLANSYNGALSEGVRQMSGLMNVLRTTLGKINSNNGQSSPDIMQTVSDLQAANNNKSQSKSVDAQFMDANSNLDAVRSRYINIPDDISASQFSIKESSGGGGNGGGIGLGL